MPTQMEYEKVLQSDEFQTLNDYSEQFLHHYAGLLGGFSRKWVSSPLAQWSRRWEYVFVWETIQEAVALNKDVNVLDAGSGVTFFPYYLKEQFPTAKVFCCDYDATFENIYSELNRNRNTDGEAGNRSNLNVQFDCADLRKLPYQDNQFDLLYCISVLEHTDCYEDILLEFRRVLAPGGRLIITFDVSLDGTRDIDVTTSEHFLATVEQLFQTSETKLPSVESESQQDNLLTTHAEAFAQGQYLPWKYPSVLYQLQALLQGKGLVSWPPKLGVYGLVAQKL